MEARYRYAGSSSVNNNSRQTQMSFAPDTLRQPTFFVGELNKHIAFREAMSALHAVVVSDMSFKPKDKTDYKAWLKSQEEVFLAQALAEQGQLKTQIQDIRAELNELQRQEHKVLNPFYKARSNYFNYLYRHSKEAWFVLDPVITVHPDSLFFECFSQDESSYAKLSCDYEVFQQISEHAYGTTNIDYSHALYAEFQKIRDYKKTEFIIDPSGFEVHTDSAADFKEEKIELPDSWVRGFLQVSSAMTLPTIELSLHPMDMYNVLLYLKRHKEKASPRSLRFCLTPDKPIEIRIEPWAEVIQCPRSIFKGKDAHEIRIWGRRRLLILERLLPITKQFRVHLLGSGMPSFWLADLEHMTFTLGLSGWSANDFSRMGNFDLLAPRTDVDSQTAQTVFTALQGTWQESAESLAKRLNLSALSVKAALGIYAQYGQVLYDMDKQVYRIRELSREALPTENLRFSNEREAKAVNFRQAGLISDISRKTSANQVTVRGTVLENAQIYQPQITLDSDNRLIQGECNCHFFLKNKLHNGPCEHMLAIY